MKKLAALLTLLLFTVACSPLEQQARNSAAALQGVIIASQAKYQSSCVANRSQSVCTLINRGIEGENALVTSVELYCGWSTTAPPTDPTAKCVPVATAAAALNSSIANAAELTMEIKGTL